MSFIKRTFPGRRLVPCWLKDDGFSNHRFLPFEFHAVVNPSASRGLFSAFYCLNCNRMVFSAILPDCCCGSAGGGGGGSGGAVAAVCSVITLKLVSLRNFFVMFDC